MAKIIVPGRIPTIARRFKCDYCGCVFDADKDEYKRRTLYGGIYNTCKCPCCRCSADEIIMGERNSNA